MPDMQDVRSFLAEETGLAVVSTTQADGRVLSSVINCGVIDHPVSGTPCVALVSRGAAARIGHVRRGSQVTIASPSRMELGIGHRSRRSDRAR